MVILFGGRMLPYSVTPFHAGRMWCHTRMVYLPMGYLYGVHFQAKEDDLILELRKVRLTYQPTSS
jgi:squalene cyclase